VLDPIATWRHAVVLVFVLAGPALALAGLVGEPDRPERFDAKQVTVQPDGEAGLRIREIVDQDFGDEDRHGYERIIPDDFGAPTDVTATSPDAPADLDVTPLGSQTRVRVGDPDSTVSGQHRYELAYTLPVALFGPPELALDIIGTGEELETGRMEIVVMGLQLDRPTCSVGDFDDTGGCRLERDGDVYRAVIEPLERGDGVTIGGTILGRTDVVDVAVPDVPARRASRSPIPLAAAMLGIGALAAGAVYAVSRRVGRNEVYAGGPADAAFGPTQAPISAPAVLTPGSALPPPSPAQPEVAEAPAATRLVADEQMDDLATIEFAPPAGVDPWEGAVVLRERIDDETIGAWFSTQAARGVIVLDRADDDVTMRRPPGRADGDEGPSDPLRQAFDGREEIRLGSYDKRFAEAWVRVRTEQTDRVLERGWWTRGGPRGSSTRGGRFTVFIVFALVWTIIGAGSLISGMLGLIQGTAGAVLFAVALSGLAAYALYRSMLPARSAAGSSVALRTESFRRFLQASEGRHVEWAWERGLLREYSAWAVALGAADAWERALSSSSVPPAEMHLGTGPLLVHSMGGSFSSTHTAPSSSGSGGSGGGFSGGSVGGGGGGGSSGSW